MPFKTVAIAGFGTLGKPIVEALLAASITPIILSRDSSKPGIPSSVKVLSTGYTDKATITAALKEHNVEVVISILGDRAWDIQVGLAEAAKDAGVQLFFPTEFGLATAGHTEGYQAHKDRLANQINELVVHIFNGIVSEWVPFVCTPSKYPGKVVVAKGLTDTVKGSFTSLVDISGFIAHILSTLPLSQLESKIFRLQLQGEALSFQDIATLYGKELVFAEKEEFDREADHEAIPVLQEVVEKGWGSTGHVIQKELKGEGRDKVEKRAGEANGLWEGHTFLKLKDVLKEFWIQV